MTFDFTFANIAENDNFYSALFEMTNKFSVNTTHVTSERIVPYNAINWYVKIKVENPTITKIHR